MPIRSNRKPKVTTVQGTIVRNKVHDLIEYIEKNFREANHKKRNFATAALTGTLRFLDEISQADEIPQQKKIELFTKIYEVANRKIEELVDIRPEPPLWANRAKADWRMSPCTFVELYYPTYRKGLTTDDIKDKKLLRALQNFKIRYGWPKDFDLPSKSSALDRVIETEGRNIHLRGLSDVPPRVRRERVRIWKAHIRRLNKKK
jgi:hypothetical protein